MDHQNENSSGLSVKSPLSARRQNANAILEARQLQSKAHVQERKDSWSDLDQALSALQESAAIFRANGLAREAADNYLKAGEILFIRSRYKDSLAHYKQALALTTTPDDLYCSALSHIALAYLATGDYHQALSYSRNALELAESAHEIHAQAEAQEAIGEALLYEKDPNAAMRLLLSAADTFRSLSDLDGEGAALYNAGLASFEGGFVDAAMRYENDAMALWASSGNIDGTAKVHAAMALLALNRGDFDIAHSHYQQSLRIFHNIGDIDNEAVIFNGLGLFNREIGNSESSLAYFQRARTLFVKLQDDAGLIVALEGIGKGYWILHQYTQARSVYEAKLNLLHKSENYRSEAMALSDLAEIHWLQHDYRGAERLFRQARELCKTVSYTFGESEILTRFAQFHLDQEQPETALLMLREALQLEEKNHRTTFMARIYYWLAAIHKRLGQFTEALEENTSALAMIESEREKVGSFDDRASYFSSVHEYYRLYISILMHLHEKHPDQGFERKAFEAAEKSKVRSLLDMLSGAGQSPGCTETVSNAADNCSASYASALNLPQIQAELKGSDSVLLEFSLGEEQSYLWMVDENKIQSILLPGKDSIANLIDKLLDAIKLPQRGLLPNESLPHYKARLEEAKKQYARFSTQLSNTFFAQLLSEVTAKRLIIVPDSQLQYLPFAGLPLPGSSSRGLKLINRFELVELPSASALKFLRDKAEKRSPPAEKAAVVADPVFTRDDPRLKKFSKPILSRTSPLGLALRDVPFGSSYIPRLFASRHEADAISDAFGPDHVRRALDFDANRNVVLMGDLRRYRYIHFATHGILDARHPEFSGLILSLLNRKGESVEGYLRLQDIYRLNLSADLVVLSSCNSALGKDMESEGIIGLPRAFLYAGSKAVISTLWKVDDNATAELMRHFYAKLHQGEPPSTALKDAQLELSRIRQWKSPYYWAAFILQGEYR